MKNDCIKDFCTRHIILGIVSGTSAEACVKTVKLASARYYDDLPTIGNEYGRAFRDIEFEKELLAYTREKGSWHLVEDAILLLMFE